MAIIKLNIIRNFRSWSSIKLGFLLFTVMFFFPRYRYICVSDLDWMNTLSGNYDGDQIFFFQIDFNR